MNSLGNKTSTSDEGIAVDEEIFSVPGGEEISVDVENKTKFITNLLGKEYLHFRSYTDFYWVETAASELILYLNEQLLDANWQLESDWGYQYGQILLMSVWNKGDLELSILLFDDLDSIGIESLSKNYGISGPVPGSTMYVMHMIDNAVPIP